MQALELLCFTEVFLIILGIVGMELTFPLADLTVLYFVSITRTVLITHWCFGYCWAVLVSIKDLPSNHLPQKSLRMGKMLGGGIARTEADHRDILYYVIYYMTLCSAIKSKLKKEGHLILRILSSKATTTCIEVLFLRKCIDITHLREVGNQHFCFLYFHARPLLCFVKLLLSQPRRF